MFSHSKLRVLCILVSLIFVRGSVHGETDEAKPMRLGRAVCITLLATCSVVMPAQTVTAYDHAESGPLSEKHSVGGTVIVGVALADGLVLAGDSRVTLQFPNSSPAYKIISDSGSKIFSVGRIGIATYGEAFILSRSIASFISAFEAK
ncbi:MAG TPA: hypothetical protein VMU24_11760, partial [Candidatus Acidoferrales bacterium]|nr:hypothetical protein [Candidatus Acidoferrales bacterium]